jgi:hypothetical protein
MEVRNLTADEIAFVQVKSSADQAALDYYIVVREDFRRV